MGGLLGKFLTDKQAENQGVWVAYEDAVNDDGTYPEFCIKRISTNNTSYQAKVNPLLRQLDALSRKENANYNEYKKVNEKLAYLYIDEILVDWRNVKHEAVIDQEGNVVVDENGVAICEEIPFSKEKAREILGDPDFIEVLNWLMKQSTDVSNFLVSNRNKDLKF
jgi:hypothetical protein